MSQEHEVTFFRPGQIVFHVAGEANVDSLIDWANSNAPQGVQITKIDGAELKFPPPPEQNPEITKSVFLSNNPGLSKPYTPPIDKKQDPFTLVPAKVTGFNKDEEMDKLLDLVLLLDEKRKDAPGNALQVVSPNWVMSGGSSDPGGTGGPGGRPTKYGGQADTQEHLFHFGSFRTEDRALLENGQEGAGVVVAILDTAPIQPLHEIYDDWVTNANPKHTLLQDMQLNGALRVRTYPDVDIPLPDVGPTPPEYLQTDEHDYLMADHGLFVAGIIHSLAPKAQIALLQVLNRYGVGDLMSLARGFGEVAAFKQYNPNQNLLVNTSLTMQFPLEEAHIDTDKPKGRELGMKILNQKPPKRPWYMDLICEIIYSIFRLRLTGCEASWFERQALPLLSICQSVSILGSDIIAAAGNKRKTGNRPQAEYPAAFPDVLGVGALPKNPNPPADPKIRLRTASYSNFSDRPQGSGIATLGGEKEVDEKMNTGILGIYVGDFPGPKNSANPPTPSANGWAYWCGTSFATAVMTGLTANMLSNRPGKSPQSVINELKGAQPYLTEQNEEVLFVTQGPP